MLRKFISYIIPNKGTIFFTLFEEAIKNAHAASQNFIEILNSKNEEEINQLSLYAKSLKQQASQINKNVLSALNNTFITPIDRGDIQELSGLLNKLTKRIVKISSKLKIYTVSTEFDDDILKNADTLLLITKTLVDCIVALKEENATKIEEVSETINELEEDGNEDFKHAINEMYSGKFDTLTILKLKEIYKSIEAAIETGVAIADLAMQVSIKRV
ncbi:MAG: hypothetical protein RL017_837 [Pseudomonadota bacterium]|nr:DUF47 family protein [Burkholderiales bacterium]